MQIPGVNLFHQGWDLEQRDMCQCTWERTFNVTDVDSSLLRFSHSFDTSWGFAGSSNDQVLAELAYYSPTGLARLRTLW